MSIWLRDLPALLTWASTRMLSMQAGARDATSQDLCMLDEAQQEDCFAARSHVKSLHEGICRQCHL